MKRLATSLTLLPAAAFAHTGHHSTSFFANLDHLLTQPDHLIMLGCAAALAGMAVFLRKAGKL